MNGDRKLTEKDLLFCAEKHRLQLFIAGWREETFGRVDNSDPKIQAAAITRVMNEATELDTAVAIFSTEQDEVQRRQWRDKISVEMADVAITLFAAADIFNFDLLDAVVEKMKINLTREWASSGDGTGYHIKKSPLESQS